MFLYNGFRLGVRRAMAHTLTAQFSGVPFYQLPTDQGQDSDLAGA